MICVLWIVGMCFTVSAFAADREAIQANVDEVVAEVNEGAEPTSIQANDPEIALKSCLPTWDYACFWQPS